MPTYLEKKPLLICIYQDKDIHTRITSLSRHEFQIVSLQTQAQLDKWLNRQENEDLAAISVVIGDLSNPHTIDLMKSQVFIDKVKITIHKAYSQELLMELVNKAHIQHALLTDGEDKEFVDVLSKGLIHYNYQKRLLNVIDDLKHQQVKEGIIDAESRLYNKVLLDQHLKRDMAKSIRNYQDWIKGKRTQLLVDSDFIFFSMTFDQWDNAEQQGAILMQIAGLLNRVFRELDSFVRMDDNLFLIVARFSHRFEAHKLAERLRKNINSFDFENSDGSCFKVTASIGFACFPFDITKPEQLTWQQVVMITQRCMFASQQTEHNQWIGLHVNSSMKTNTLYERMLNDPQQLVDDRELQLLSSMPPKVRIDWGTWLQQAI
jgi:diguanylate cyclase (GGDEF)-like protein